jgi:Flp pilus assembly pilin Flp
MSLSFMIVLRRARSGAARSVGALGADDRGATAIEFAMVAVPFLMLAFGIIAVGLYFFTTFALENAVEQTARLIRTGQAQESGMTKDQFKQEVCSRAPGYVDCDGKLRVNVQSWAEFANIAPPSCTDAGGDLVPKEGTSYRPGAASEVVLVTVCYEWELADKIPFLKLGNMANGSALIQAATTFRTEPYGN